MSICNNESFLMGLFFMKLANKLLWMESYFAMIRRGYLTFMWVFNFSFYKEWLNDYTRTLTFIFHASLFACLFYKERYQRNFKLILKQVLLLYFLYKYYKRHFNFIFYAIYIALIRSDVKPFFLKIIRHFDSKRSMHFDF